MPSPGRNHGTSTDGSDSGGQTYALWITKRSALGALAILVGLVIASNPDGILLGLATVLLGWATLVGPAIWN